MCMCGSRNDNLTVFSSKYTVLEKKSIPIVGYKSTSRQTEEAVANSCLTIASATRQPSRGKCGPTDTVQLTWYVLSKLSYINRVMREVFPTVGRSKYTVSLNYTRFGFHSRHHILTRAHPKLHSSGLTALFSEKNKFKLSQRITKVCPCRHCLV